MARKSTTNSRAKAPKAAATPDTPKLSDEQVAGINEQVALAKAAAVEAGTSDEDAQKQADALLADLTKAAIDALAADAAASAAAAKEAAKGPKLVKMVRDTDAYPKPHTADVHPDEVENFAAGGWVKA
jgi:hypothetical protein